MSQMLEFFLMRLNGKSLKQRLCQFLKTRGRHPRGGDANRQAGVRCAIQQPTNTYAPMDNMKHSLKHDNLHTDGNHLGNNMLWWRHVTRVINREKSFEKYLGLCPSVSGLSPSQRKTPGDLFVHKRTYIRMEINIQPCHECCALFGHCTW